jgi:hypothetical protein
MAAAQDDWRRTGQEKYLRGATLTWRNYQALSGRWEHEHCAFCWQKFLDPHYSPAHEAALRDEPDAQFAAGYTNVGDGDRAAGKWWICASCFADFKDEFAWTIVQTDADAWPYEGREPERRPTAADYTPPEGPISRPE